MLGHVLTTNGTVEIDRSKIADIDNWQRPSTGRDVEKLLGFCNYFRRYFILEPIAAPFHKIRHKQRIEWTSELEDAWQDLKTQLKNAVPLHLPDYRFQIHLGVDASRSGLGMVVWQDIPIDSKAIHEGPINQGMQLTVQPTHTPSSSIDTIEMHCGQNVQSKENNLSAIQSNIRQSEEISPIDDKMIIADERLGRFGDSTDEWSSERDNQPSSYQRQSDISMTKCQRSARMKSPIAKL